MRPLFTSLRRLFGEPLRLHCQPRDWSDGAGWDVYWRAVIKDDEARSGKAGHVWRDPFLQRYLPLLRARDSCRILFAGNGISLEPHVLAHCGFNVTAVDVSPAACDFVRDYQLTAAQVGHFLPTVPENTAPDFPDFPAYPRSSLDRARDEHRPGGRLEVLAQDLLRWSPTQPFDVIYAEQALKGFSEEVRREMARRFFTWLSPGGILVASTIHAPDELQRRLKAEFKAAGFLLHLEETIAWRRAQPRPTTEEGRERLHQEYSERVEAEKAREYARLAAGEKLVDYWNSRS